MSVEAKVTGTAAIWSDAERRLTVRHEPRRPGGISPDHVELELSWGAKSSVTVVLEDFDAVREVARVLADMLGTTLADDDAAP